MSFAFTLFLRFVARDVRRNWVRTLLTVLGIALGVSVYLAISIANNTAISQFKQTVSQVSGKANIELMPLSGPAVPENILSELANLRVLGVKYTPMIDEHLVLANSQNTEHSANSEHSVSSEHSVNSEIIQLIGIDMLADADFKSYQSDADDDETDASGKIRSEDTDTDTNTHTDNSSTGSSSSRASDKSDSLSVFSPRAVLVGGKLARRYSFKKGSELTVIVNDQQIQSFHLQRKYFFNQQRQIFIFIISWDYNGNFH